MTTQKLYIWQFYNGGHLDNAEWTLYQDVVRLCQLLYISYINWMTTAL